MWHFCAKNFKICFLRQTALHVAAQAGDAGVIAALIQNGIDFDALDVNNDNALHIAVREGHLNVVSVQGIISTKSLNESCL